MKSMTIIFDRNSYVNGSMHLKVYYSEQSYILTMSTHLEEWKTNVSG